MLGLLTGWFAWVNWDVDGMVQSTEDTVRNQSDFACLNGSGSKVFRVEENWNCTRITHDTYVDTQ